MNKESDDNEDFRIAMCTPMFKPVLGGAEQYIVDLSKFLIERKWKIDVFTLNLNYWKPAAFSSEEFSEGINIHRISVAPFSSCIHRLIMLNWPATHPKQRVEAVSPDLLHFHNMTDFALPAFLLRLKLPKILTCHTLHEAWGSILNRKPLISKIVSGFDFIHVFSEIDKKMLVDSFPSWSKKIRIIPHGVDPNQFKTSKNKSGNNILFVGRIHPTKGIHTLLKACLEINKTIELNIAGPIADDNYFSQLRALLTDKSDKLKVNFLGKVSRQELLLAYSEADIFVLPSSSETFPIVLLEAMASALPIVATNVGGIPEVLTNNYNGFVVNPNDSFNLSKKLKQLLNDANLRNLMGERNRKLLLTKFDLRKNYAMIEALYKELVD